MSLSTYLQKHHQSYEDFGSLIGVTATSVYRYVMGDRLPRPKIIQKIYEVTNGEVTINDFYIQPTKKPTKRKN